MDIALDLRTHDLALAAGPRGPGLALVVGGPAVAQRIKIALLTLLGEWPYDVSHGTPWFQAILVKGAPRAAIASHLRRRILSVPGVQRITAFNLAVNDEDRFATVTFAADTDAGPVGDTLNLTPVRRAA